MALEYGEEYINEDVPKCPHCDFEEGEWPNKVVIGRQEIECRNCGGIYELLVEVSYSFSSGMI